MNEIDAVMKQCNESSIDLEKKIEKMKLQCNYNKLNWCMYYQQYANLLEKEIKKRIAQEEDYKEELD